MIMSEWISIKTPPTKEQCDKDDGWFLIWSIDESKRAHLSRYDGHQEERSYDHGWKYPWDHSITHWMPLPEGPKEKE
jgi:hypothetical protein